MPEMSLRVNGQRGEVSGLLPIHVLLSPQAPQFLPSFDALTNSRTAKDDVPSYLDGRSHGDDQKRKERYKVKR